MLYHFLFPVYAAKVRAGLRRVYSPTAPLVFRLVSIAYNGVQRAYRVILTIRVLLAFDFHSVNNLPAPAKCACVD